MAKLARVFAVQQSVSQSVINKAIDTPVSTHLSTLLVKADGGLDSRPIGILAMPSEQKHKLLESAYSHLNAKRKQSLPQSRLTYHRSIYLLSSPKD